MTDEEILARRPDDSHQWQLFQRHMQVLESQRGKLGKSTGEVTAFFLPRLNIFLGKPLIHAGVYPDPAIRLVKNGKARFPSRDVHEIMEFDGEVAWLFNYEEHHDSPTLSRYIMRLNRYTDLHADQLREQHVKKDVWSYIHYVIIKPKLTFLKLFIIHAGFKDGMRGFLWSTFSAWHFPIAYWKYITEEHHS
jgi:hypothetical protein